MFLFPLNNLTCKGLINWVMTLSCAEKCSGNGMSLTHQSSNSLTHWGRDKMAAISHICVARPQWVKSWTSADLLLIGSMGMHFSEIWIKNTYISYKKMHLKMLSAKFSPKQHIPIWRLVDQNNSIGSDYGFVPKEQAMMRHYQVYTHHIDNFSGSHSMSNTMKNKLGKFLQELFSRGVVLTAINKSSSFMTMELNYLCLLSLKMLTHWARVTHICVSKISIIGSDNGL